MKIIPANTINTIPNFIAFFTKEKIIPIIRMTITQITPEGKFESTENITLSFILLQVLF